MVSEYSTKRLVFIRHSQAEGSAGHDDFDRDLTQKGCSDIEEVKGFLLNNSVVADYILCSPAKRTRRTLSILLDEQDDSAVFDETIYEASPGDLYELLKSVDDKYETVWLVGHNPAIHGAAMFLAEEEQGGSYFKLSMGYPPGAVTILSCACTSWGGLLPGANKIIDVFHP